MLKKMYVDETLTIDEFEHRLELLLRYENYDKICPPIPPNYRKDLTLWPVPAVNEEVK